MKNSETPSLTSSKRYRFGSFTLDVGRQGLYSGASRIRLTPRPFAALAMLVENHGRTVEKRELMDAVWGDTAVTEDNLVQAVREIRRALEDDKEDPRFVLTVPRSGYRFVGEVAVVPDASTVKGGGPDVEQLDGERVPHSPRGDTSLAWVGASVLVASVAIGWLWSRTRREGGEASQRRPSPAATAPAIRQLTSEALGAGKPAYSRDGKILYNANGALHVLAPGSEQALRVTERIGPSGDMPVFDAEGRSIVFSMPRGGEAGSRVYDLYRVDALGGTPRVLLREAAGAGFSPDGRWIAYTKYRGARTPLWASPATEPDAGHELVEHGFTPRFSADGRALAYTTSDPNGGDGHVWVARVGLDTQGRLTLVQRRQLTTQAQQLYGLTWSGKGELIFAGRRGGPMLLQRVRTSDGRLEPVTSSTGDELCPSVSPDGKMLIFWHGTGAGDLTVSDGLPRGRDIYKTHDESHLWPKLSPSGQKLASVVRRPYFDERLHVTQLATGARSAVSAGAARHPYWIDETHLAFLQDAAAGSEAIAVDLESDVSTLLARFAQRARWLAVSPDRRRLAVVLPGADGVQRIVLRTLELDGDDRTLAEGGEFAGLRFVIDGRQLGWSGARQGPASDSAVWIWRDAAASPQRLVEDGYGPAWSDDGSRVCFQRIRQRAGLWCRDLRSGQETRILEGEVEHHDVVGERSAHVRLSGRGQVYAMSLER